MEEKQRNDEGTVQSNDACPASEEKLTLYARPKRNGKFLSKLESKALEKLQWRKSLFMYLSSLFLAVSLLLPIGGREKLIARVEAGGNALALSLSTLYLIGWGVLIVLSVYVSVMSRTGQKIGAELKEKNVPRDGLDRHTFISYEAFNVLHLLVAAAEIAVSVYGFDAWSVLNIAVAAASAVFAFLSRQILFRANAGNLEYLPAREEDEPKPSSKRKHKKK